MTTEIACFISPHGFGHATRTTAVLEELLLLHPDLHPHVFTTAPKSLFSQTLQDFTYHRVVVDIGLVQTSSLDEDIGATIASLEELLPFSPTLIQDLADRCQKCAFILCDIAPLGIAVARHAGIPSILLENFTWDWIYEPYQRDFPELTPYAQHLRDEFALADYHIQTEPLCNPNKRDLLCEPIFRKKRGSAADIRTDMRCFDKNIILITLGGGPSTPPDWPDMEKFTDYFFIFSGQEKTQRIHTNVLHLDRHSNIYHPDLIDAADLVVCKAGYSTIAECCQAGSRIIAVGRTVFPETKVLQTYIQKRLGGLSINAENFLNGHWLTLIPSILATPSPPCARENGAQAVSLFLTKFL